MSLILALLGSRFEGLMRKQRKTKKEKNNRNNSKKNGWRINIILK